MSEAVLKVDENGIFKRPVVIDWLWRPIYAKLWWGAAPLYWIGMAASLKIEAISVFYSSAFAGFLTVFFYPPLVALILSYGFLKAWLATVKCELDDDMGGALERRCERYGPSGLGRSLDPLDPGSGYHWIGSPSNPSHPFYVIRFRHSS